MNAPDRHVRLGIALAPESSVRELVAIAAEAEGLGCDTVWVNDDRLQKDVFTVLATIGGATQRVRLGPGVTNPWSRHPALLASASATLDEASGGRAVLGLGAGGTNHRMLGIERRSPARGLHEAITLINGLLAGEAVTLDGQVVKAQGARLEFTPVRSKVPIYVGARGPRVLEVAGELADGVIVGSVASAAGWRYAIERVSIGCERAGRSLHELSLSAWLPFAVADDRAAAIDAVRPMVTTSLITSRPILAELEVELPERFTRTMESLDWSLNSDAVAQAAPTVPEELIERFAIAGTVSDCRERLEQLLADVPEIGELSIIPFPVPGQSRLDVVQRFLGDTIRTAVHV
jgi:5,10-methylenetetrahydromethanopterin reductase